MPFVEGPRHAQVTSDDIGPIIQIVAWFLMVVMIMATVLRLLIRFTTVHVPGADDALVSIAMVLGIGEVIAISLAVNDGLGTRPHLLSTPQLFSIEKAVYASNILYILTITFAKFSTLLLIYRLANVQSHLIAVRVIAGFTLLWALAALFGQAFQCTLPNVWEVRPGQCFSIPSFWDGIGSVDIVLDLFLIAMPARIVWDLHMHWSKKLVVVSGFSFRIALCGAQVVRLIYLKRTNEGGNHFIYETLGYTLATQCQTMLAVVAACIPALKPFMDRAASGLMGISFQNRAGTYDVSHASYEMPSLANRGNQSSAHSRRSKMSFRPNHSAHQTHITSSKLGNTVNGDNNEDYMIQKTMDWDVQYSDEARLNQKRPSGEDGSSETGDRGPSHLASNRDVHAHNVV